MRDPTNHSRIVAKVKTGTLYLRVPKSVGNQLNILNKVSVFTFDR